MIWVIDAHTEYQAGLNVPHLAQEGYGALVVKATQGATGYTAPAKFDQWIAQARAAGMIAGAYHWINDADPVAQVDHFLRRLAPVGGPDGLLCQLDCEDNASLSTVQRWIAEWNRRTGNHPLLLYTGGWWWQPRGWNGAALTPYLWASHYVSGSGYASVLYDKVPASWWAPGYGSWSDVTILQFSSKGTAGGITANVDVNAFRGTLNQLRALARIPSANVEEDVVTPELDARLRGIENTLGALERFLSGNAESVAPDGFWPDGKWTPVGVVPDNHHVAIEMTPDYGYSRTMPSVARVLLDAIQGLGDRLTALESAAGGPTDADRALLAELRDKVSDLDHRLTTP